MRETDEEVINWYQTIKIILEYAVDETGFPCCLIGWFKQHTIIITQMILIQQPTYIQKLYNEFNILMVPTGIQSITKIKSLKYMWCTLG